MPQEAPTLPLLPPYYTWSPWSSATHKSYTQESADAATPSVSHRDDQDVFWCEETKVVTVVHTGTTMSWTPTTWSPFPPHSSSSSIFTEGSIETGDVSSPYDTQIPFEDNTEGQPLTREEEQCFASVLSTLPSCATACYESAARSVGCASDYRRTCQQAGRSSFHYYLGDCLSSACEYDDYEAAYQLVWEGISPLTRLPLTRH